MPGLPIEAIIGAAVITICCLVSTILGWTLSDKILPGDQETTNYKTRIGLDSTYTVCTICLSALAIGLIVIKIRQTG